MKLTTSLAIFAAAVLPCNALVKVTYDTTYDDPTWPLTGTACSNGANGLASKWPTLGDVPSFPYVGGVPGLTWNSPLCGTCWELCFVDPKGVVHTTTMTAVDAAGTFNMAKCAFADWTCPEAVDMGFVMANATQVPPSKCGIM